jgi:thiamine pyrophosphate-dependent acetolactate synthase large subunit-like protein
VAPDTAAIEAARALLAAAQRPLIIAGGGARHAGAALAGLLEAHDAYLVTTVAAKGVVPDSHPGNLGASLPYRATQELIAAADVVLAAGTELAETDVYTTTRLHVPGRLIRVDIDAAQLAEQRPSDLGIHGDSRDALEALARGVGARRGWRSAAGPAAGKRQRIEAQIAERQRAALAAVRALRAAVPPDGVIFSDMTQIAYTGNYAFAADRPGTWFHPSGYGTLGFALPAAIGAKLAQPERAVMALAGDFGVQFTLQELVTAVELQLPLPVVVWNNQALAQIRDDMLEAGIEPVGVTGRNPDFEGLAAACGARGLKVSGAEALARELRAAFQARGPTLLEVRDTDF